MTERISGKTQLIGLLGTPISHSLSPKMHNEAFTRLGLDYVYLAFDVGTKQLEDVLKGYRAMGIRGCNVTMPNKVLVRDYLDALSPAAELAGAVNTIVNEDGILTGHITDGTGYMRALTEEGIDVIGEKMTIAGAGGAATAICIQAALDGVKEISIFNRQDAFYERAKKLVLDINAKTDCKAQLFDLADLESLRGEIASSVIFINATSVGMEPLVGQSVVPDTSYFRPGLIVSDVVYVPAKTQLLEMAEEAGCKTVNGLGMMLWQGAKAFEIWTGKEMPVKDIKALIF
ncbi:shikimate dehydrogenase [Listeria rocourtiae]|uniref:shikimate dehydrogenase n=1 Tax=Listeria rocourtiae TaxID=647910 RepID=UPI003D2F7162